MPGTQTFNEIHTKNEALEKIAAGMPTSHVAKIYDVDNSTISKLKARNQDQIKLYKSRLIQTVAPKIIQRIEIENDKAYDIANATKDIPTEEEEKFLTRIDKTAVQVLKGTGILETQTMSYVQNQQNNVQQNNLFTQDQGLFANHVEDIMGRDYDNTYPNGEDNIDNTPCITDTNSNDISTTNSNT